MDLSESQGEKRAAIQKSATILGVIIGAVVGLIALWALGSQGGAVRYGGALVVGVVVGVLVFKGSFSSQSKSAQCGKCGAAFSRSRTDRSETVASSEAKEEREALEDGSKKVTTWVEEKVDVVDSYTCASCGDVETKEYQTTRKRDEEEQVFEAPKPKAADGKKAGEKGGSGKRGGTRGRK